MFYRNFTLNMNSLICGRVIEGKISYSSYKKDKDNIKNRVTTGV